jgi:hypothetical protein
MSQKNQSQNHTQATKGTPIPKATSPAKREAGGYVVVEMPSCVDLFFRYGIEIPWNSSLHNARQVWGSGETKMGGFKITDND